MLPVGTVVWISVKPIIKIYLILLLGFTLTKIKFLTRETFQSISKLTLGILLPLLIFNKIVTNIEGSDIKNIGIIVLSAVLIFVAGAGSSLLIRFVASIPKGWYGGLLIGGIFPNISDIPVAYLQSFDTGVVFEQGQGDVGVSYVCIFMAVLTLCLFNFGMYRVVEWDFKSRLNDQEKHYSDKPEAEFIEETIPRETRRNFSNIIVNLVIFFLKNFTRPCSIATITGLLIAFIPWLKALFVITKTVHIHEAPDHLPPLNFMMDFSSYVGQCAVPFGLILLGSAIASLKTGNLPYRTWISLSGLVLLRLVIMPIIGILWVKRLVSSGWISFENDQMLIFVILMNWGLPSMTIQLYLTSALVKDTTVDEEEEEESVQMDCISAYLLLQYPVLAITMPIYVSYIVKVLLKY